MTYLLDDDLAGGFLGDVVLHAGHQHGGAEELVQQRARLRVLRRVALLDHCGREGHFNNKVVVVEDLDFILKMKKMKPGTVSIIHLYKLIINYHLIGIGIENFTYLIT